MFMDADIVAAYYGQVSGAGLDSQTGQFALPCTSTLPDLSIVFGSTYTATISGDSFGTTNINSSRKCCSEALCQVPYCTLERLTRWEVANIQSDRLHSPHSIQA